MTENKTENKPQNGGDKDAQENKTMALLSYISILFLVPLLAKRDSKFCQFHAKQGMILFGLEFALSIFGWFLWIPPVGMLLVMVAILICVIGVMKTLNGEYWKIPYIYEWSEKIKI